MSVHQPLKFKPWSRAATGACREHVLVVMMEITGFRILSFQVRIRTKEGTELICVTQTEYIFVVVQNCTPVLIKPRADALSGVSRQPELCSKLTLAVDLPEEHCSGASGRHGQSRAFSFCSLRALLANGIPHWFPRRSR